MDVLGDELFAISLSLKMNSQEQRAQPPQPVGAQMRF